MLVTTFLQTERRGGTRSRCPGVLRPAARALREKRLTARGGAASVRAAPILRDGPTRAVCSLSPAEICSA